MILASVGSLLFVAPALAATVVTLSPATINVAPGKTFDVAISVNPQGTANYVEKVELTYPADLLEVKSFTQGNAWMGLTQPGYDLMDNTNGVLLKSAGYPSGITAQTPFGTVTFSAKKAGTGTINIGGNSVAFEVSTQSTSSGTGIVVTIATPAKTTTTTATPTTATASSKTSAPVVAKASNEVTQPATIAVVSTTTDTSGQAAAVVTSGGLNLNWLWITIIVIILIGLAYYLVRRNKKSE